MNLLQKFQKTVPRTLVHLAQTSQALHTEIAMIQAPSALGQTKNGVQRTPHFLSSYYLRKMIDLTTFAPIPVRRNRLHKGSSMESKFMEEFVLEDNYRLSLTIKRCLGNYCKTIVVGGDHSISLGSTAGVLAHNPQTHVIWVDAHADINTMDSSASKNMHGMPLSYLTGVSKLEWLKHKLPFTNLIYIGLRDIDNYEQRIIDQYQITTYSVEDLQNYPEIVTEEIVEKVGDNPIHISLDVDVFDPQVIPSTGTPVGGGLRLEDWKSLLQGLPSVNSLDVVELNMLLGTLSERERSINTTIQAIDCYIEH